MLRGRIGRNSGARAVTVTRTSLRCVLNVNVNLNDLIGGLRLDNVGTTGRAAPWAYTHSCSCASREATSGAVLQDAYEPHNYELRISV